MTDAGLARSLLATLGHPRANPGGVRAEALGIAASRSLGPGDVKALDAMARTDPDPRLRVRATTIVVLHAAPELAVPVLSAALDRGDVDRTTADAAALHPQAAMVSYVRAHPQEAAWAQAIAAIEQPCSAPPCAR